MVSSKLTRRNARLDAVLDCFGTPAAVIGLDQTLIAANRGYREQYRSSFAERGRCYEVTHGCSCPCKDEVVHCPIQRSLETGCPYQVQHSHIGLHGKDRVTVLVQPIHDSSGRIAAFMQTLRPSRVSLNLDIWPIIGASPAFKRLSHVLEAVAPTTAPVLIRGEAGSGVELVARSLHKSSPQSDELFVPLECAGLSERAFEIDFFGEQTLFHRHTMIKRGLVEGAGIGRTIFLNDVGALGPSSQSKLLFLLEDGRFRRIGDSNLLRANIRLVFGTQCELEPKVADGLFNRNLFRLLSLCSINVPPLRKYLRDLPLFVVGLLQYLSDGRVFRIAPSAVSLLQQCSFPGNIRELISVLERACLCADGNTILPEHLPLEYRGDELS